MTIHDTLSLACNCLGLSLVECEAENQTCYALATLHKPDDIFYGPVYESEPLDLSDIASHLLEILNDCEPDEITPQNIYLALNRDSFGEWAYIYAMAEIMSICDGYSSDFCEETKARAAQEIVDTLCSILTDALEDPDEEGSES